MTWDAAATEPAIVPPYIADAIGRRRLEALVTYADKGAHVDLSVWRSAGVDLEATSDEQLAADIDANAEINPAEAWAAIDLYRRYRTARRRLVERYLG